MMKDLMFTRENGDRERAPNIAVVLTDGASSIDSHLTVQYAEEARAEGVIIFSIGIGNSVNDDELLGIAGDPSRVIHVSSFEALPKIQAHITTFACDLPACEYSDFITTPR